jgi:hypothetical protein
MPLTEKSEWFKGIPAPVVRFIRFTQLRNEAQLDRAAPRVKKIHNFEKERKAVFMAAPYFARL